MTIKESIKRKIRQGLTVALGAVVLTNCAATKQSLTRISDLVRAESPVVQTNQTNSSYDARRLEASKKLGCPVDFLKSFNGGYFMDMTYMDLLAGISSTYASDKHGFDSYLDRESKALNDADTDRDKVITETEIEDLFIKKFPNSRISENLQLKKGDADNKYNYEFKSRIIKY